MADIAEIDPDGSGSNSSSRSSNDGSNISFEDLSLIEQIDLWDGADEEELDDIMFQLHQEWCDKNHKVVGQCCEALLNRSDSDLLCTSTLHRACINFYYALTTPMRSAPDPDRRANHLELAEGWINDAVKELDPTEDVIVSNNIYAWKEAITKRRQVYLDCKMRTSRVSSLSCG